MIAFFLPDLKAKNSDILSTHKSAHIVHAIVGVDVQPVALIVEQACVQL